MALASASWDDYPAGRFASSSAGSRRPFFSPLVATIALAGCLAGAVPLLQTFESFRFPAPEASSAELAAARQAAIAAASRALFERDAENFARDSLRLTPAAMASELGEAEKLGSFTHRLRGIAHGSPLEKSFSAPVANSPAVVADRTGKEIADTFAALASVHVKPLLLASVQRAPSISPAVQAPPLPVLAPVVIEPSVPVSAQPQPAAPPAMQPEPSALASVHIEPSVVVPLAADTTGDEAPVVPAPRLERPSENAAAVAAIDKPMDQASLPLGRSVPLTSPAVGGRGTAVYDISAAMVYLPDGERLEAHSGLGYMVDNPRYVDRRDIGPTPPNTYKLARLEKRFFGVEALRLVPVDGSKMYGRDGFLTHTYLLRGRPAQSNGCVVFKDYDRFLNAYKRGLFDRLVVVPTLAGSSVRVASTSGR